jgi:Domain of unknown function (DUF305)
MSPRICFVMFCLTSVILTSCQKSDSPVDVALAQTMTTMHSAMDDVLFVGEPDADFALMMIPHHQRAVDMAKVELQFGTDPPICVFFTRILTAGRLVSHHHAADGVAAADKGIAGGAARGRR